MILSKALVNSSINLILEDCLSKHTEKVFSLRICKKVHMKEDKVRISTIRDSKGFSYCSVFPDFFSTMPNAVTCSFSS